MEHPNSLQWGEPRSDRGSHLHLQRVTHMGGVGSVSGECRQNGRHGLGDATGPAGVIDWRVEIGEDAMIDASPVVNPVTLDIYVGTTKNSALGGDARLFAFRPNGQLRWAMSLLGYDVRAAPAIKSGFLVVVGHKDRLVPESHWSAFERAFLINPFNGSRVKGATRWGGDRIWDTPARTFRAAPAVDERNETYIRTSRSLSQFNASFDHVRDLEVISVGGVEADAAGAWKDFFDTLCFWCIEFDSTVPPSPPGPEPRLRPRLPSPAYSAICDDVVWALPEAARAPRHLGRAHGIQPPLLATTPALGKAGRLYAVIVDEDQAFLEAYGQSGKRSWRAGPLGDTGPVSPPALGKAPGDSPLTTATCTRESDGTRIRDHRPESVYIAAGPTLFAFNDGGQLRWRDNPGGRQPGEPVVVRLSGGEELIVVPTNNMDTRKGDLVAYRSNGTTAWRIVLDGPALGSPAVANGRIYVATTKSLYAIR